jgi:hypothetical protein
MLNFNSQNGDRPWYFQSVSSNMQMLNLPIYPVPLTEPCLTMPNCYHFILLQHGFEVLSLAKTDHPGPSCGTQRRDHLQKLATSRSGSQVMFPVYTS